jgi:O-antigen/teichoic acid export membrane protein
MANLRRSLVINFISSSGAALIQFLVSVLLARVLSPSEIGIFSMTVVFVNIGHIFRDFGVSTYIQREAELTQEKLRSAIGVMFTTSWSIALLMFALSGWLGKFFDEPDMVPVMRILALGFVVIPFGTLTQSMLVRELKADKQAIVTAISTLCFCAASLGFALAGFGSTSLAWANFVNIVVCALCYIPLRPAGMPWMPSFRNWREIMRFGVGSLIGNCAWAINNSIPDILLGKLSGARSVGLFSRANSTVSIFNYVAGTTVTYGAVSYMSKTYHRGESLVPTLKRATLLLTGVGWPAFALTAVFGRDIVEFLYGGQWMESVPAILPLTIAAGVSMLYRYTPSALIAMGKPHLCATPVVVTIALRVALGFTLFNGSLSGFAWIICLATFAALPVSAWQQTTHCAYPTAALLRDVWPSVVVTAICSVVGLAMETLLAGSLNAFLRLLIVAVPSIATWYLALRLTRHPLLEEVHHLAGGLKVRMAKVLPSS